MFLDLLVPMVQILKGIHLCVQLAKLIKIRTEPKERPHYDRNLSGDMACEVLLIVSAMRGF